MDDTYSQTYLDVEKKHWWFVGRRKILGRLIAHELEKAGRKQFDRALEIGCFAGINIEQFKNLASQWSGIEPSEEAGLYAQQTLAGAEIVIGKFPDVTVSGKFDLILLFDVLEHIEDPVESLKRIRHMLNPGGVLIMTVPAYQWLWTEFDEINQHYRRYTAQMLQEQLSVADINDSRVGYFNALLFIPAVCERLLSKYRSRSAQSDKISIPTPLLNRLLDWIFSLESFIVPYRFFPYGLSVISISTCKK